MTKEEMTRKIEAMSAEELTHLWTRMPPETRSRIVEALLARKGVRLSEEQPIEQDASSSAGTGEGISDFYESHCEALFDAARGCEPEALAEVDLYEAQTEHGHIRVAVDRESFVSVARLEVEDEAGQYRDTDNLPDEATRARQKQEGHARCRRALDGKKPKKVFTSYTLNVSQ